MTSEVQRLIALEAGFTIHQTTPVKGGFTAAEKFIAEGELSDGQPMTLFVKLCHVTVHTGEAIVLESEAAMYELIAKYETLQRHFPTLHAFIKNETYHILLLDYLADASWGGPWTERNIRFIHTALTEIHHTKLSSADTATFTQKATYLRDTLAQTNPDTFVSQHRQRELFSETWDSDHHTFTNSRGDIFWRTHTKLGDTILGQADLMSFVQTPTVADVNFGNIGFTANKAYIVDPVYLTMGNAATDMVGLGINILRDMAADDPLRDHVKRLFIADQPAFAKGIIYWVSCTALPYLPGLEAWMDYHQSCAKTALATWEEMYEQPKNATMTT